MHTGDAGIGPGMRTLFHFTGSGKGINMSFSSDVKNEIILKDYINEKSALSELVAIVCFGGKLRKVDGKYVLSFVTENPRIARRIYSLLKGTLTVNSRIKIRKN
jgi:DNA-binding protein WhiA